MDLEQLKTMLVKKTAEIRAKPAKKAAKKTAAKKAAAKTLPGKKAPAAERKRRVKADKSDGKILKCAWA